MKRRPFDLQVLMVLLFVALIFFAWILIRIKENRLGLFSESIQMVLYANDLQGLRERAEIRCRGAVVGHVKKIEWGKRANIAWTGGEGTAGGSAGETTAGEPERFWVRGAIHTKYKAWKFSLRGHVRAAVVQSAVTPSWIELTPATATSDASQQAGSLADVQLVPEEKKPGAEGAMDKVTEIGDALLEMIRVINPPKEGVAQPNQAVNADGTISPQAAANQPLQKVVKMIDDLMQTSKSLREFASRLEGKSGDDELNKALQNLKTAVAKLHDHVSDTDGMVQETTSAMAELRQAAKNADVNIKKFGDLADRFGDTFMGRVLVRKKSGPRPPLANASPTPRPPYR